MAAKMAFKKRARKNISLDKGTGRKTKIYIATKIFSEEDIYFD